VANHVLHRRAIVFSDFRFPIPRRSRAHARGIAPRHASGPIDATISSLCKVADPREKELPNVGVSRTGRRGNRRDHRARHRQPAVRKRFNELAVEHARRLVNDFRSEGVDTLELKTDSPYMPALQRFFKTRERRRV